MRISEHHLYDIELGCSHGLFQKLQLPYLVVERKVNKQDLLYIAIRCSRNKCNYLGCIEFNPATLQY